MSKKKRAVSTFSLSFLDIMSCGLGAVVLIFLLLRHTIDGPNPERVERVMSEVSLLEEEIKIGEKNLIRIRNTISDITDESVTAQGLARRIEEDIKKLRSLLATIAPDATEDIKGLQNRLKKLQQQKAALEATELSGTKAYEFTGDGDRQYLTGLKLGGRHVLILLDASASMLDEKIVNIVRRRNMSDSLKQAAPKWERAKSIARWVIANLPLDGQFQVVTFNTEIKAVIDQEINEWYEVSDREALEKAVQGIAAVVPQQGTSLSRVFDAAMQMDPRPDNIYLITDGLPTQGKTIVESGRVSGRDRVRLFNESLNLLFPGIPVNTMLLPLEGDTLAAASFWRLAALTKGAFVAPARDWP